MPLQPTERYATDQPELVRCRRCNRPVIQARGSFDFLVVVDPVYLTPLEELRARMAERLTYRLSPDERTLSGRRRIDTRFLTEIRSHPGRGLGIHHCDRPRTNLDLTLLDATLVANSPAPGWE